MNKMLVFLLAISLLLACSGSKDNENKLPPGVGLTLVNRDTLVRPTDDFFTYVNGGWLTHTEIPMDRGVWGSFNELTEQNNRVCLTVLQKASASQDYLDGTDQRKAADFYGVGMDSLGAEKIGADPLKSFFARIDALSGKTDLQNFLITDDLMGGDAFFRFWVEPDLKNSQRMSVFLGSGGIGLPERDYYLKADPKSKEVRDKYKRYMTNMLVISGWDLPKASKASDRILLLETMLANATMTKEERRDPRKKFNRRSVSELTAMVPSIQWTSYFKGLGVTQDSVLVTEPVFLKEYDKIVNVFGMEDIKAYLRWTIVRGAAPYLNHSFVQESFDFNSKYMLGIGKMLPRWKRVLNVTDIYLGEAIGKLYVAEVFPPEAKARAQEMVENIRFAFADRIKGLDWMGDSTKAMALKKLSRFTVKIGYPDKWKTYAGLTIEKPGQISYYDNVINASKFQVKEQVRRLSKPVDRTVWDMTPQTVNAYNNSAFNEIVIPAGILQPPFYDYRADEAVNYGGIGAAIGHEISHGFDDEGSQYDADGNLKNWWTPQDLKRFKDKGKALAEQFNKYQPLPGVFVQGQFTLGENIGDLGGLSIAYDGLQRFFRENNLKPELLDGFTPEQRFFISWATIWRTKYRNESLQTQILTNEHAPSIYRVNGPVSNLEEFYKAFGVIPGDKLYRQPSDRVRVW
jgi:putative endopeptidase